MHQIQLIVSKCHHRICNTDAIQCFLALPFGIQLKYKITNILVLFDLLSVYWERINSKHDLQALCVHT